MNLARRWLAGILVLSACALASGRAAAQQPMLANAPRVYVPVAGEASDVNGDGVPDVDAILRKIDELATVGVKFDDADPEGYLPPLRKDGRYHMACIDLLHVCYRAAGYDIPAAMQGGHLLDPDEKLFGRNLGMTRSVVNTIDFLKRSPAFHWYPAPQVNLVGNRVWRPAVPFMIGDMVFVHYDDATDRHSGIVTGVDPATGLPTHITQVSIYNENQGLHRATIDEFFALKCRMLTGWCRPACWDGDAVVDPVELRPRSPDVLAHRTLRPIHVARSNRRQTLAAFPPSPR